MAKWWLSDMANRVAYDAVQLHGGYGYMAEYPISRFWTDARVLRIYGGTSEIMKELVARGMLGR
jgi:acyl-CoA dehydrogenase